MFFFPLNIQTLPIKHVLFFSILFLFFSFYSAQPDPGDYTFFFHRNATRSVSQQVSVACIEIRACFINRLEINHHSTVEL